MTRNEWKARGRHIMGVAAKLDKHAALYENAANAARVRGNFKQAAQYTDKMNEYREKARKQRDTARLYFKQARA